MLSLALSMILYGVLANSQTLGTSDGLFVPRATFPGLRSARRQLRLGTVRSGAGRGLALGTAVDRYNTTIAGALATPMIDNELRIEFLGRVGGQAGPPEGR